MRRMEGNNTGTRLQVVTARHNHKIIFSEIVPGHVTCQWLIKCEESVDATVRPRGGGVFRSSLRGVFAIGGRAWAAAWLHDLDTAI